MFGGGGMESNSSERILSPFHIGESGTGEIRLDSSLHRDSTDPYSSPTTTSSSLLTMVKNSSRVLFGESSPTSPTPLSPHHESTLSSTTSWSEWLSASTPRDDTRESMISRSSITMTSSSGVFFNTGGGESRVSSSSTSSSVGKMISQWTGMDKSRGSHDAGLSLEDEGSVSSWTSILPTSPSFQPSPSPSRLVGETNSDGLYLKQNKLTHLATWVNSSGITDHIVELPRSLPLIDLEGGVSGIGGGVFSDGNLTNETFLELDNCTFVNGTSGGVNCTDLGVDMPLGYNYWALLLIVFSVFAVFGNMLVILSVKRERSLWNVTNYFIVSLAIADLLVAAVVMPFGVYVLVSFYFFLYCFSLFCFSRNSLINTLNCRVC